MAKKEKTKELDKISKVEIAKVVLSEMIAAMYREGYDSSNETVAQFLTEEREVDLMNMEVVDRVLSVYAPEIKKIERERNGKK